VRLPLVLLLFVLGAVAGAAIWLTLTSDGAPKSAAGHLPHAEIRLAPAAAKAAAPPKTAKAPAEPGVTKQTPPQAEPAKPESAEPGAADTAAAPAIQSEPAEPAPERSDGPGGEAIASRPPEPEPVIPAPELPIGLTLPRVATGPPLSIAPDPALVQRGEQGLLPIIGADGRKPWQVYARPFDKSDKRPRIAIIVMGLGHSSEAAQSAIQGLPGPVTLAFSPYSRRLDEWIRLARTAGHEVLIHVPMEPVDFPDDDPGPNTLLTGLQTSENAERLLWALGRGTGYVGVVSHKGSRFTADSRQMFPVLAALHKRGLLFVDSRTSPRSATPEIAPTIRLPWTIGTHRIDPRYAREPIDARLRELETIAKQRGRAVGIGTVSPVTFERIAAWVNGVERRGFVLAPVSAVVDEEGSR
jgi:polysaccharide deacetylase 2 family uncharacterized protein YibQ